jgi:hypothetical protein
VKRPRAILVGRSLGARTFSVRAGRRSFRPMSRCRQALPTRRSRQGMEGRCRSAGRGSSCTRENAWPLVRRRGDRGADRFSARDGNGRYVVLGRADLDFRPADCQKSTSIQAAAARSSMRLSLRCSCFSRIALTLE